MLSTLTDTRERRGGVSPERYSAVIWSADTVTSYVMGEKSATIPDRAKREKTSEREKHLKRFEEWRGRAIIEKGFCLSCLASGSPRYFEFSSDVIDPFYGNFWIFTESIQNFFFFIYKMLRILNFEF